MFLKKLTIQNGEKIIREIQFRKGINLIVDETTPESKTESGNSVGKTTVLRLIDFCLDGEGKNIYVDPEFKSKNSKIENFLKNNNVLIILVLVENIDNEHSKQIVIERNFLSYNKKIQTINGEQLSNEEFSKVLKDLIFKTRAEKPSFRQLISKNIRDEKNKLINTLKVLAPNVTTDVAYEALHLFWLGIDSDISKDKLVRQKNTEIKLQQRLRRENNLSQINQSLIIIDKEIKSLTDRKNRFKLNEEYESDLSKLNTVKSEINAISSNISRFEMRKDLIEESKLDLENDLANIDTKAIKHMYEKAKSFIPSIHRTFEDVICFHNQMIHQKVKFITEEMPSLERELQNKRKELSNLLLQEKVLSEKLSKSNTEEDLENIILDLNSYHERKGSLEEQKRMWIESNKNLKEIENKLKRIDEKISSKDCVIQDRIEKFNSYFSNISSRLDGVHSLLSADKEEGVYKFMIGNIEGNPGTGSKKSQMASFDLAYIKFADEINIPCLHFVLQDQIENVHANQITNLLTEIVGDVNCQYVLPVLRDKLPKDIDVSHFEILSLSQKDKLFRL